MEIWIIEGGEKVGPIHDYEVRERISRGELGPDSMVWHEGRDGWIALKEVELFEHEFEVEEEEEAPVTTPPPLPNPPRPFLRFWARWFDFFLYEVMVFGGMRVFGADLVAAMMSPMFMTLHLLPWLVLEGIAVHLWKTTPGKWLLGFRVQRPGGDYLRLGESVLRAFRVFVLGMGMHLSIFLLMAHGFGLWYLLRFKKAAWDHLAGLETRCVGLTPPRIAGFVVGFYLLLMALSFVLLPASSEMQEEMRKLFPELFKYLPEPPSSGA